MSGSARSPIPREVWVLVLAALVIALGYGLIAPILPQFAKSFDVSITAASLLISAFAFFRLVFAPVSGALVNRLGERQVYIAGVLIVALSTGAVGFAHSYAQLLVFRMLGGIGSTMFSVSALALIVRLSPPDIRGRVSSAYGSAFLLGSVGGPVLGGLMSGWGMRTPFLVYAGALLVATTIVALNLGSVSGHRQTDAAGTALPVFDVADALRDSTYRAALVATFANGCTNFGIRVSLIPLFAAATFPSWGWAPSAVMAVFAAGNGLALSFAGRRADLTGRKPMLIAGLVVSGIFTVILGYSSGPVTFAVLCALAGFGSGLFTPAIQAAVADMVGSDRQGGKVIATYQMAGDVGAIVGPLLGGRLADTFGYPVAFLGAGLILLIGAASYLGARETLTTPRPAPGPADRDQPG